LAPDNIDCCHSSLFMQRLGRLLSLPQVVQITPDTALPPLPLVDNAVSPMFAGDEFGAVTQCQSDAIAAVRRVVTGHRKRPVVITADRGRGKSAAMGLAAASLLQARKIKIAVTAPSFESAKTIFRHVAERFDMPFSCQRQLAVGLGVIDFVSPDMLLSGAVDADFVIVDEAAAIPAPLLSAMLDRFNRIVFSSTVHGYEGTGRGFAVKFRQILDTKMPHWRSVELAEPVRWANDDPLENWVFQALLFAAPLPEVDSASPPEQGNETHNRLKLVACTSRALEKQELLSDELLLTQVFGLLVNAHYQTSPADLVAMLDDDKLSVIATFYQGSLVGCCLVMAEGGLDEKLAEQVQHGTRRIKGHLLAQSMAAHLGLAQGAVQRCGRIMRIAVHPELQQQGIGQVLLQYTATWAQAHFDYLGTSFGYVPELLQFWHKAGYRPVRLGLKKDAASGYQSLQCTLALTSQSQQWLGDADQLFAANLHFNASECFSGLSASSFTALYRYVVKDLVCPASLPQHLVAQQLALYCRGGLGYELALPALTTALISALSGDIQTDNNRSDWSALAVAKVIQRKPWPAIVEEFNLSGRKEAEQLLRDGYSKI
ncbi:GNAT family N-acetyltransferase, partial [Photobacterium sanctipauli]